MSAKRLGSIFLLGSTIVFGQDPASVIQSLKSLAQQQGLGAVPGNVLPGSAAPNVGDVPAPGNARSMDEEARMDEAIRRLKAMETGPRRFCADLFDVRKRGSGETDGGVSEQYVLGGGDRINVSAFGSATFDTLTQVDGRGMVNLPKVGVVKVGGSSLGQARQTIQNLVKRQFSNTTVDIQAIRLREVRVMIMGEVYAPGSYLVPSLSSLVNVLSLAGGPNALGSFRQIKVIRGGKVVHQLDLYPYRSEGLGNTNFYMENGDTVFVPLAQNKVILEGAFTRVAAAATVAREEPESGSFPDEPTEQKNLRRQIQRLESLLAARASDAKPKVNSGQDTPSPQGRSTPTGSLIQLGLFAPSAKGSSDQPEGGEPSAGLDMSLQERDQAAARLTLLKDQLQRLKLQSRADQRIPDPEAPIDETAGQPRWLSRWQLEGVAPTMQFEMLPGETAADALQYAGGFDLQGMAGRLTLRRIEPDGSWKGIDVLLGNGAPPPELQRGDVLTALPRRDGFSRTIQVAGWVKAPGIFSRSEGLRVGELLKRESLLLPDTYLGRGEITRPLADGTTTYFAFDVNKALAGDPTHDRLLEDRDRIYLYRTEDLRLRRTLSVVGPVKRPGDYEFHEGMRASDLLFRAGVPLRNADRFVAELSHVVDGKTYRVKRLDLAKLLSTEAGSPVELKDDAINPLLEPYDRLSVFEQSDFRSMRTVTLAGQVVRPGQYTLDSPKTTLMELVERAGGLTPEAMPEAGIYLREVSRIDPDKAKIAALAGVPVSDPTLNEINQTLQRLNETKRHPINGSLLTSPLLHGLETGRLSRLVVDIPSILRDPSSQELELQDGDQVIFPTRTDVAYVVGEAASPFAVYKVEAGMSVGDLLEKAGGTTRNADRSSIRLLRANGQIVDNWVRWQKVRPGDTVLVPQRIRRDTTWQENLQALTPLALILNAIRR